MKNKYESLEAKAYAEGVEVIEMSFSAGIKGLYGDGTIAINKNIITNTEKACVLAEELGHHNTIASDITDYKDLNNRKLELKGRAYGYNLMCSPEMIACAALKGCRNKYELAEELEITEDYLEEALTYYKNKYGLYVELSNDRCLYFEPLIVAEYNYMEEI